MPADILAFLDSRISVKGRDMTEPGPSKKELKTIIETALRVPDHGKLKPWRVVIIEKTGREKLNKAGLKLFERENPDASELALEKERSRFSHAPCLLVVASIFDKSVFDAIPKRDQLLSGGALCMNILHAAHALGYTGSWITGWPAYHKEFPKKLGLPKKAKICGFIYLGTPKKEPEDRKRPKWDDVVTILE